MTLTSWSIHTHWLIIVWGMSLHSTFFKQSIENRRNVSCLDFAWSFFFLHFLILGFSFFFCAEMMSKFNKDMYAKIKGKKNEPLSSIGQKTLSITDKEKEKEIVERGSSTSTLDEGRVASLAVSIEEVPAPKRRKMGYKGKEKIGSSI